MKSNNYHIKISTLLTLEEKLSKKIKTLSNYQDKLFHKLN